MTRLACRVCGRRVDSVAPAGQLTRDERRCPRCGARLEPDRRIGERRQGDRRGAVLRTSPVADPGPPGGLERRVAARRIRERRREESVAPWSIGPDRVVTGDEA